jgi:hypothetical protein
MSFISTKTRPSLRALTLAFGLLGLSLSYLEKSHAIDNTDVLPRNINRASIKIGNITGLNEYYTSSGELKYLTDINAVELNAASLSGLDARAQMTIDALNDFSGSTRLGDQLHLGQLFIDAKPEITYFSPVLLHGFTDRLTVGLAVPFITYKNDIQISNRNSNFDQMRAQFAGLSPELAAQFSQLDYSMEAEFRRAAREAGYTDVVSRDDQFVGDVQLVTVYQIPVDVNTIHAAQLFIGLPTGPKPDADDLTDVENFHRLSIRPNWVMSRRISSKFTLLSNVSYQLVLPSEVDKRVPLNEQDLMPALEQKMSVTEDIGDTWSLNAGFQVDFTEAFSTGLSYGFESKESDTYEGVPEGRAYYLQTETDRQAQIIRAEMSYSMVKDYLNHRAILPASFSYQATQVISGINVENQLTHEITLNVFF